MTDLLQDGRADVVGMSPPRGGDIPPADVPCLFTNNVTGEKTFVNDSNVLKQSRGPQKRSIENPILSYDRKCAEMLFLNACFLLENALERCAFLTITTPQNLSYWTEEGWEEARNRFRSWVCHKGGLPFVFGSDCRWCRVIEPQKRGAIHWHMLIDTGVDIRTGVDFDALARGDYKSAGKALLGMWARMRKSSKAYNLGRCQIMPIKADKYEAAARYIGKYISKGIIRELVEKEMEGKRKPPHSRRVGFSSGWRVANTRFAWLSDSADTWRRGVSRFAEILGVTSYEDLKKVCGKKWAYDNREYIQSLGFNQ